jgi:hypothetical protein
MLIKGPKRRRQRLLGPFLCSSLLLTAVGMSLGWDVVGRWVGGGGRKNMLKNIPRAQETSTTSLGPFLSSSSSLAAVGLSLG